MCVRVTFKTCSVLQPSFTTSSFRLAAVRLPYPSAEKVMAGTLRAYFGLIVTNFWLFREIVSRNRHWLKLLPYLLLPPHRAAVVIHIATICRIAEFAQPRVPKEPFEI